MRLNYIFSTKNIFIELGRKENAVLEYLGRHYFKLNVFLTEIYSIIIIESASASKESLKASKEESTVPTAVSISVATESIVVASFAESAEVSTFCLFPEQEIKNTKHDRKKMELNTFFIIQRN